MQRYQDGNGAPPPATTGTWIGRNLARLFRARSKEVPTKALSCGPVAPLLTKDQLAVTQRRTSLESSTTDGTFFSMDSSASGGSGFGATPELLRPMSRLSETSERSSWGSCPESRLSSGYAHGHPCHAVEQIITTHDPRGHAAPGHLGKGGQNNNKNGNVTENPASGQINAPG